MFVVCCLLSTVVVVCSLSVVELCLFVLLLLLV